VHPNPESLKALPARERNAVSRSARRGTAVGDPSLAMVAVEYARRWGRFNGWLGGVSLFLGVASLITGAIVHDWIKLAYGLFLSAVSLMWFYNAVRAKRSIPLNQALLK
jgi:hypothetical protein